MNTEALLNKIQVLLVAVLIFTALLSPVAARSITDINSDIRKSQEELDKLKAQIDQANKELAANQAKRNSSSSEIGKISSQIEALELTYDMTVLKKQQLENEIIIKDLEREEREKLLNEQLVDSYISWKTDQATTTILSNSGDVIKSMMYYEFLTLESTQSIKDLAGEIDELNTQTRDYAAQVKGMETSMIELKEQKVFWEKQIALYNEAIASASSSKNQLVTASSQLEEQQKQYNEELEKAVAAAASGSKPLISGELYFSGSVSLPRNGIECTGSYRYSGFNPGTEAFGHGIGMSQWGAHGMAKIGKSANEILTFYYQGSAVETRPTKSVTVNGGTMNMEVYVAGLGEVPDKACGNMEQVQAWNDYANQQGWAGDDPRREKYLLGGNCWPEEAIKAQVIAARTYAYNRPNICGTDSCQVYKGGNGKAWAAHQTKDQIVASGGVVIDAFYSGYNNNGAGSADIETVWTKASPKSYLRSVNDNSMTTTPKLCNQSVSRQGWRTNSYSIAMLDVMLNWAQDKNNWGDRSSVENYSWNADVVRYQIKNVIGNLKALRVENDASGRAKKVIFVGDKGQGSVSGIFFRMMFNSWAERTAKNDGLKSITFDVSTAK